MRLRPHPLLWITQRRAAQRLRRQLVWLTPQLVQGRQFSSKYASVVAALGIGSVLDLRDDAAHDSAMLAQAGLRCCQLPLPEFDPPTLSQLEEGVRWSLAEMAGGRTVFVHCTFGKSRSVCLAAAILMAQGHSLSAAVHVVRMARPSSMLTGGQLACLVDFERRVRERQATA